MFGHEGIWVKMELALRLSNILRVLGAVFLGATAVLKLQSPDSLAIFLTSASLAPPSIAIAMAYGVIAVELILAGMLLSSKSSVAAARFASMFACVLTGVNLWRLIGGVHAPCSCLGPLYKLTVLQSLALSSALAIFMALTLRSCSPRRARNDILGGTL